MNESRNKIKIDFLLILTSESPYNIGVCVQNISYEVERLECIGAG